jgi:hypothetical protein
VRTGASFYFSSLKPENRPRYCAFFAYFEAAFFLPGVFTQPRLQAVVSVITIYQILEQKKADPERSAYLGGYF